MKSPTIYPGLLDKRVEFFAIDNEVYCFHGKQTLSYNEFPGWITLAVINHMNENPALVKKVQATEKDFGGDFSKRYIYYIFGGLNLIPDIDVDGTINPCDFYNCDEDVPMILQVNNGKPLSKREIEVLRSVTLSDKAIADRRYTSRDTVITHFQNIRIKTGLTNKPELVEMACKQGVI